MSPFAYPCRLIASFVLTAGLTLSPVNRAAAQELPQPTEQHQQLAREVGVWNATVKMWVQPDAEPVVSQGKETCQMFGKFWLVSEYEGDFASMPFSGRALLGYDTHAKQYVSTWADTTSPDLFISRGSYDAETHTLTLTGEGRDMLTGKLQPMKLTTRYIDNDHKTFEFFEGVKGSDEWRKTMQMDYVREK
jgi:hypothetical protein